MPKIHTRFLVQILPPGAPEPAPLAQELRRRRDAVRTARRLAVELPEGTTVRVIERTRSLAPVAYYECRKDSAGRVYGRDLAAVLDADSLAVCPDPLAGTDWRAVALTLARAVVSPERRKAIRALDWLACHGSRGERERAGLAAELLRSVEMPPAPSA